MIISHENIFLGLILSDRLRQVLLYYKLIHIYCVGRGHCKDQLVEKFNIKIFNMDSQVVIEIDNLKTLQI